MAYKRVTKDGKKLNQRTYDMVRCAEDRLGYNLYIVQGSYNSGGVSASAGTHDGGGAIDVPTGSNPDEIVRTLREVGFAAWHRKSSQGPWNPHIHAIAVGDEELSSGARRQVSDYFSGKNGLASHAPDDGPRIRPIPVWPIKFPMIWSGTAVWQSKAKKPVAKKAVREVQKALRGRGYYDSAIDGLFGPKTRKAFKDFTTRRKLSGGVTRANVKILCKGYNKVV